MQVSETFYVCTLGITDVLQSMFSTGYGKILQYNIRTHMERKKEGIHRKQQTKQEKNRQTEGKLCKLTNLQHPHPHIA